jgi:gas vesicle protein
MKEEMVMNKDNVSFLGIGLLIGAVIGGVIALLYAPKSGKKTRQIIENKATKVVDTVKKETSGVMNSVKDAVSEAERKGQAVVNAVKD